MTLAIVLLYLAAVLTVGFLAHRLFRGTGEDYFLATRTIGPFVLLMTLFGTHMTAFSLLGASGEAYHRGIGVFSLMASSSALVAPALFYFLGLPLWAIGKRHGFLTQVQFFRERWGSQTLALALFALLVALLVPYLLIGVLGGGIAFEEITTGRVPRWAGSLLICAIVSAYVTYGGLRSTAWVNTLQTLVFMGLGAATFVVVVRSLGGLGPALARVDPGLLLHGDRIGGAELVSYTLVPLSVGMFPHIFMHWLTARRATAFRLPIVAYPLCIAVVWVPSVLLGVLGSAEVPGLAGSEASSILVRMIRLHAPEALAGLLAAGVLAAVMSSLDSQALSLSTLFTQDVARRLPGLEAMDERRQVLLGRLFVVGVLAACYLLSLVAERSIFRLGVWSFTGFAALVPLPVAALYWRRSTATGALAAVLSVAALWALAFLGGWPAPESWLGRSGVEPVAWMLPVSALAMVAGSLLSRPPEFARVARFFPPEGTAETPAQPR